MNWRAAYVDSFETWSADLRRWRIEHKITPRFNVDHKTYVPKDMSDQDILFVAHRLAERTVNQAILEWKRSERQRRARGGIAL